MFRKSAGDETEFSFFFHVLNAVLFFVRLLFYGVTKLTADNAPVVHVRNT